MELQDWRKEPRKNYSNEFKLRMVELASQPGACVAQIARENGVNDNVIFKWLRLWQNEGRVSRRLPVTTSSDTGVELLPVEITPDEQKEPVAAIAPSLSTSTQTRVSASSCKVEFRHGNMTLENPSPELLTVLIRELTGREDDLTPIRYPYLARCGVTDMRKSFNGLGEQVQHVLNDNPFSGHLFIFRGRRGDTVKILWADADGLCLFTKRLEEGQFIWPAVRDGKVSITRSQLAMLLDKLDWRQPKTSSRNSLTML